ncbi:hypothetical protein HPT25_22465 [Bacillus sp. BRMEA1]|uniref:hypothetical protein n=1 Tax=Neobacillus endophyticus TaxID=2738405 RepID=UPI001563F003|nr:hypothetical protein [Neobacillus endophyticus]NRD80106.1 hypothetical protein [Neobacillus endophyticus]
MAVSFGILVFAGVIFFIEARPLLKKRYIKEFVVFSIMLLFGTALGMLKSLGIAIPNPLDGISLIYRPISNAIWNLLK